MKAPAVVDDVVQRCKVVAVPLMTASLDALSSGELPAHVLASFTTSSAFMPPAIRRSPVVGEWEAASEAANEAERAAGEAQVAVPPTMGAGV